jgi:rod shape-determining protein MreC
VGAGDTASLALPYLPGNADVKPGDLLVTSGLGGVFPAGYPVARVSEVHRDAVQPLAQVRATPFADVDRDREVMLVWFRADHPAAPATAATGDLPVGNKNLKPQPAPAPRPKAPPAAPPEGTDKPTNSTATSPNASGGARKPTASSGTVNPTGTPAAGTPAAPGPSSKKGNTPAPASDAATSATSKEPAAGEGTPSTPTSPTPEPQSDATPRDQ